MRRAAKRLTADAPQFYLLRTCLQAGAVLCQAVIMAKLFGLI